MSEIPRKIRINLLELGYLSSHKMEHLHGPGFEILSDFWLNSENRSVPIQTLYKVGTSTYTFPLKTALIAAFVGRHTSTMNWLNFLYWPDLQGLALRNVIFSLCTDESFVRIR
ncbi:purine nucleoside phosphorylase [Platysternon megacephalum]|uniref:Purine nucleoside phosphorylase n=1 Tax=Platysternon megacephalum TaxID=55544 RepID=A0A4D9DN67_9SAUR|nr:purine nucleoside phosphorylase [Platysternon megacephalum]